MKEIVRPALLFRKPDNELARLESRYTLNGCTGDVTAAELEAAQAEHACDVNCLMNGNTNCGKIENQQRTKNRPEPRLPKLYGKMPLGKDLRGGVQREYPDAVLNKPVPKVSRMPSGISLRTMQQILTLIRASKIKQNEASGRNKIFANGTA